MFHDVLVLIEQLILKGTLKYLLHHLIQKHNLVDLEFISENPFTLLISGYHLNHQSL